MSEEEKKEQAPEKIKVGEKEYTVEELGAKLNNESKLQSVLHENNRKIKEMEAQLAEKNKPPAQEEQNDFSLELPSEGGESEFLDRLITTVNTLANENKELKTKFSSLEEGVYKDVVGEVHGNNQKLFKTFVKGNNIGEEELDEFQKILASNRHNRLRANGKALEITPEALEESLFLLRKDQVEKRGENKILKELFGKDKAEAKNPKDPKNPDLSWLAEHWHELSDEEKDNYKKMEGYRTIIG